MSPEYHSLSHSSSDHEEIIIVPQSPEDPTRPRPVGIERTPAVGINSEDVSVMPRARRWTAALLISGSFIVERMVYTSVSASIGTFILLVIHQPFTTSAISVSGYAAVTWASQIIGRIVADEWLGPHLTMFISNTLSSVGLVGLAVCATVSALVPSQNDCDWSTYPHDNCVDASPWQKVFFYAFLYVSALGAAGRTCASPYRDHQFHQRSKEDMSLLEHFCTTSGVFLAFFLPIIQSKYGWRAYFWYLALMVGVSNIIFITSKYFHLYRQNLPTNSPLKNVAQVFVAANLKKGASSSGETSYLYDETSERQVSITNNMRCLNKAAIVSNSVEMSAWRVCTVANVEDTKILIRLLPIAACTIMLNAIATESLTLSIQQASTMNTNIGLLQVPVACFPMFPAILNIFFLLFYHFIFDPLFRYFTGHSASMLSRVCIGLVASSVSVLWAAIFEMRRRNYAIRHGYKDRYFTAMPNLSAYWLMIQYSLISLAEVFCLIVGIPKLIDEEVPCMKGISDIFGALVGLLGGVVAILIHSLITIISNNKSKISWLHQNINIGRYDYLYGIFCVFSIINLLIFRYVAKEYKYRAQGLI